MTAAPLFDPSSLANRGILRGHVCTCGQAWPDFVRTGHALQVRTECCGVLYQLQTGEGRFATLSLLERPAHLGPELPSAENTWQAPSESKQVFRAQCSVLSA